MPGFDGACRAAMEAMAMEKPIISSKRGILPDLVQDGKNGIVVEDTPVNLAMAMQEMLNNKEKRLAMGKKSRKYILREHTIEKQVDAVARVYEKVLNPEHLSKTQV